jgi:hypothetical protein
MTRAASLAALTLAIGACTQSTPSYVVRLDLDRIAAQTQARQPGFTMVGASAPRPVTPS